MLKNPKFKFFKQKGLTSSKENVDIISTLIIQQLTEIEQLTNKALKISNQRKLSIWENIFSQMDKNLNIETLDIFKNYIKKHKDRLPITLNDVQRFLGNAFIKLKYGYYIDQFNKISHIVTNNYEKNHESLEAISFVLNELNNLKQVLNLLQKQGKASTDRLEARRIQNVKSKLAETAIELIALSDKLDNLPEEKKEKNLKVRFRT